MLVHNPHPQEISVLIIILKSKMTKKKFKYNLKIIICYCVHNYIIIKFGPHILNDTNYYIELNSNSNKREKTKKRILQQNIKWIHKWVKQLLKCVRRFECLANALNISINNN